MEKSELLLEEDNNEYIRYSAANVMKLEYSEMQVSILAIVIGLDKEKEKALILTHEIKKEGSQGKIIAREIDFKIDPEGKNKKDILNHLREKNDPIYSNLVMPIDSNLDKPIDSNLDKPIDSNLDKPIDSNPVKLKIVLTFLVGDDFESLYEEMPKYVNFHLYIEWYHIFYHDDFTPDFGTYNIVKYSLSNYNRELWKSVNNFFEKNPEAIAYSKMPNVELTKEQTAEVEKYEFKTDNAKNFSLEKNSGESNYFSLKWGNKIYGLRESINYFNKTSYFTKDTEMNVAALQSMNKKEMKYILLGKIEGIGSINEEKLRKSEITTSTLFEKYITINEEANYEYETAKEHFTLYLEKYHVTKNDGKMIFKHIYSKGQNLLPDCIGTIVSPAAKTLKEVIKNAIRDISLRNIKGIGPRNEEKLRKSKITTSTLFDKYIKINERAKYDLKLAKSDFILYLEQCKVDKKYGEMIFEDIYSILQIYELHLYIIRTAEKFDRRRLISGMDDTLKNTPIKDFESILEENESILCDNKHTIAEVVKELITIDQESNHDILKTQTVFINYFEFLDITEGSRFRIFIQCYTLILTYMLLNRNNDIKVDTKINEWNVNEKAVVSSIFSKNSYSKMILFGGNDSKQSVVEIDIQQNSVEQIGNLSTGKQMHCSEKIENYVFVLGDRRSKKIEKYNLESNQSRVLSFEMTCNKDLYSSVVYSNRIYVIGGRLNGNLLDTVEYFEPEKMEWIDAPKLLQPISFHDSVIVDEIIYAVGDYDSNKFQRFDPREGKWSFLADIPNKTHFTALSVFEHTITCSGGVYASSLCQVYDIKNKKWDELENLTNPVLGGRSIENETSIIVAGNGDQFQSYNKDNKTWDTMRIKLPKKNAFSSKIWL